MASEIFKEVVQIINNLKKEVKWVYISFFSIVTIAIILSIIWPAEYKSEASFIPAFASSTPFTEVLAQDEKTNLFELLGEIQSVQSDILAALLNSRSIMDEVVDSLDLLTVYKMKHKDDAVKRLSQTSNIEITMEGIIVLTVRANKPVLCSNIANVWLDKLDKFIQSNVMSQAKAKRIFIEKRTREINDELNNLDDSLLAFQSKFRITSFDEEMNLAIETYFEMQKNLLTKEIEYNTLVETNEENPYKKELMIEIQALKNQIKEYETKWRRGSGVGFSVPLSEIPKLHVVYTRLSRGIELLKIISDLLSEEYEGARIEERRNTPTIVIIDRATPPEKRFWPNRKLIIFSGIVIAFFVSIFTGLSMDRVGNILKDFIRKSQ